MDRQREIIEVFRKSEKEVLKKSEIIKEGKICYYYNTEKHVGDTLSRMVRNGLLERVKIGYYKLSGKHKRRFKKDLIENPNQINLF